MDATVQQLKEKSGRIGWNIRFRGRPLKNKEELKTAGVRQDDELHAFPPSTAKPSAEYQAKRRLDLGVTRRSTAHRDLHRETQSVIMSEHKRTREVLDAQLANICIMTDTNGEKLDRLESMANGEADKMLKIEETKLKIEETKLERVNAERERYEAFARRVGVSDGTTLEQAKFDAAKAQAKVRKIQEDIKIEKLREKAERKAARCTPRPPATVEKHAERAASTTEPAAKRYKKGKEVKIKSPTGNKEFDGRVVSQAEGGYYRVFVKARDKVARVSEANLARSLTSN